MLFKPKHEQNRLDLVYAGVRRQQHILTNKMPKQFPVKPNTRTYAGKSYAGLQNWNSVVFHALSKEKQEFLLNHKYNNRGWGNVINSYELMRLYF